MCALLALTVGCRPATPTAPGAGISSFEAVASSGPVVELFLTTDPPRPVELSRDGVPLARLAAGRRSFRDRGGLDEGRAYHYAATLVGGGEQRVVHVRTRLDQPGRLSAVRPRGGGVTLAWRDESGAETGYRVLRRRLGTGANARVVRDLPPGTRCFHDPGARRDDGYHYSVIALAPDEAAWSHAAHAFVGGDAFGYGLDALATRAPFRSVPREAHEVDAGERVVFRDPITGTPVFRLTAHPGRDTKDYAAIPLWNADGSRLLVRSDAGPGGVFVIDADGRNRRALGPWVTRWDPRDPERVYQFERHRCGRRDSTCAPGRTHPRIHERRVTRQRVEPPRLLWQSPEPSPSAALGFEIHPDGRELLVATGLRSAGRRATVYRIWPGGEPPRWSRIEIPESAHRVVYAKDEQHTLLSAPEGPGAPVRRRPDGRIVSDTPLPHADPDPTGRYVGFRRFAAPKGVSILDTRTRRIRHLPVAQGGGHVAWQVSADWLVASIGASLYRVFTNGSFVELARPGERGTFAGEWWSSALYPSQSPDGTKTGFGSNALGDADVYAAVTRLPSPPDDVRVIGDRLAFREPALAREIGGYDVWVSRESGAGYRFLARVPAPRFRPAPSRRTLELELRGEPGPFFTVTSVERSGLVSLPAREGVRAGARAGRRFWIEPEEWIASGPGATFRLAMEGAARGLHVARSIAPGLRSPGVRIRIPGGRRLRVFARTRSRGAHAVLAARASSLRGGFPAEPGAFRWHALRARGRVATVAGDVLELRASSAGVDVDTLLFTDDASFRPPRERADVFAPRRPSEVAELVAEPLGSFACRLRWRPPADPLLSRFEVYASPRGEPKRRAAERIASPAGTGYTDDGLAAGLTMNYRVTVRDRTGRESAGRLVSCATPEIRAHSVLELAGARERSLEPRADTGGWRFEFRVPHADRFVAWLRVHSADGRLPASRSLDVRVDGERLGSHPLHWRPDLRYAADRPDRPLAELDVWVPLPLLAGSPRSLEPLALDAGRHRIDVQPRPGDTLAALRVSGFLLTNDLARRPGGRHDLRVPNETRPLDGAETPERCASTSQLD